MAEFKIGNRSVGGNHPCFVIAEAGINHQGDMEIAKKLIDVASFCGADAVKFQKRTASKILTQAALDKVYDSPNAFGKTYGEHRDALELNEKQFEELKKYTEAKGLIFLASGWDPDSVDLLERLGVEAYKFASADLNNIPLLQHTAKKGKPIILSTGMSTLDDVTRGYEAVREFNKDVAILQCCSAYPSNFEDINLNVITTFQKEYPEAVIGYSGHERGIAVSSSAAALGAKIVERHFTLDRTMKGGDHAASLEPEGLRRVVRDIRAIEKALGDGVKRIYDAEKPVKVKLAKSIVAAQDIAKGTTITLDMLGAKSPGDGIPPYKIETIAGKKAVRDIKADTHLSENDFA